MTLIRAWCRAPGRENSLAEHSVSLLLLASCVNELRERVEVVARRSEAQGVCRATDVWVLAGASMLLHDVGKACLNHQKTVRVEGGECKARFRYHEVVSAVLVSRAITDDSELCWVLGGEHLAPVVVYAVLSHHQAMSGRALDVVIPDEVRVSGDVARSCGPVSVDGLRGSVAEMRRLLKTVVAGRAPVPGGALDRISRALELFSRNVRDLDLSSETHKLVASLAGGEGGYELVRRFVSRCDPRVWGMAYVISGVTMICDTLAAAVQRGEGYEQRGLAKRLVREMRVSLDLLRECIGL